jgi:hypothetical protein
MSEKCLAVSLLDVPPNKRLKLRAAGWSRAAGPGRHETLVALRAAAA